MFACRSGRWEVAWTTPQVSVSDAADEGRSLFTNVIAVATSASRAASKAPLASATVPVARHPPANFRPCGHLGRGVPRSRCS
jgi:hypothetical protein